VGGPVLGYDPRIGVGEWRARDPTQFALPGSWMRDVALLFAGASFGGPHSVHLRFRGFAWSDLQAAPRVSMSDPPRLTRLDEPCPNERPTSDVPCHSRAPIRGSSPRSQLVARTVTGRLRLSPVSQDRLAHAR
jgi:hypothetical protein